MVHPQLEAFDLLQLASFLWTGAPSITLEDPESGHEEKDGRDQELMNDQVKGVLFVEQDAKKQHNGNRRNVPLEHFVVTK